MMWFNLCFVCYVLANLIICRAPIERPQSSLAKQTALSVLTALLVTAYDLAADPYMVFVVKAWVMEKEDGWWFGETLQGFVGWASVSFLITMGFRLVTRSDKVGPVQRYLKRHVVIPASIYLFSMCFFMANGFPVETRTVAFFAMGVPLVILLFSLEYWRWDANRGTEA